MRLSSFIFQLSTSRRSPFLRELRRMTSRRIYLGAAVVMPLCLLLFMATIFGDGQMRRLPVGVVDADNTATSRQIVRSMEAVPTFDMAARYADDAGAREAVRRKDIYGYISIPQGFEADVLRGANPTLCYYYHYALLAVGGEVMSAFETALIPVRMAPIVVEAVATGATEEGIETFLLPLTTDDHALYNPSLDYAVYLAVPIYYIMLQILVLLVTLYAVGSERRQGTGASWLHGAGGSIYRAVAGKLLPYTFIFCAQALLANMVFFHWEHIPFAGDGVLFALAAVLFVVATQAVAVILYTLFPVLALVISVVSMVGSLGATLSGLTFPLSAMAPVVRYVAQLFPVRHFTEAMQAVVYADGGFAACWPMLAVLGVYPLVAVALLPRLRKLLLLHPYDTLE